MAITAHELRSVTAEDRIESTTHDIRLAQVAVLGLGYVGLPTSIALGQAGLSVKGIDISAKRLADIRAGSVDLLPSDRAHLRRLLDGDDYRVSSDPSAIKSADAVLICVPTPVDEHLVPDLGILKAACATVVENARPGQTIILTSTSYVGTTRDLLIMPLQQRGLVAGRDVAVAFAPERIDPGNLTHEQSSVPRVVGGASPTCAPAAAHLLERIAPLVHVVSSIEAAELTKLHENTFRAVNIALANELADSARAFDVDPMEVIEAAATKPYGYMPFFPGPGVGGHCIPCDPHYLLWGLRREHVRAPVIEESMAAIEARPTQVARAAVRALGDAGVPPQRARVLIVGAAYKPGVEDVRESPALRIIRELSRDGVTVEYHDPLVPSLDVADDLALLSTADPDPTVYDLVLIHTLHPTAEYGWLADCHRVLDATYRAPVNNQPRNGPKNGDKR